MRKNDIDETILLLHVQNCDRQIMCARLLRYALHSAHRTMALTVLLIIALGGMTKVIMFTNLGVQL